MVSDCCPQSDLWVHMLGLGWAIDALNLIFFWTCWDSGEGLLPLIGSLTWHAGTEMSDCCPQSDLFLDMLGLRWAIAGLSRIFFWVLPTSAVLCPWARHFTPRKYWLITQEAVAPSRHDWKIVDWDVKPQHKQNFSGYAGAEVSDWCLKLDLLLDMVGLSWAIAALDHDLFLEILWLRWAIVALNLIFY